uniref:Uncharacterized protein n=1 Tax=Anguilla anguilla TaxID=7936 RepID=A0A0E9PXI0_ANGAN
MGPQCSHGDLDMTEDPHPSCPSSPI